MATDVNAATKKWQGFVGVTQDGVFGPATTAATKAYQKSKGLAADGIVGAKSWASVGLSGMPTLRQTTSVVPKLTVAPITSPAAQQAIATDVKSATKTWQGIIGVTQDGIFGAGTSSATKIYQASKGLTADGIVGPKTWQAAGYSNMPLLREVTVSASTARVPVANVVQPSAPSQSVSSPPRARTSVASGAPQTRPFTSGAPQSRPFADIPSTSTSTKASFFDSLPPWLKWVGAIGLGAAAIAGIKKELCKPSK